jgi:hypothetical protein
VPVDRSSFFHSCYAFLRSEENTSPPCFPSVVYYRRLNSLSDFDESRCRNFLARVLSIRELRGSWLSGSRTLRKDANDPLLYYVT